MIKWLSWRFFVWEAIIFVASANEEILLYGWQPRVEASNEAASANPHGPATFPPVERESRIAENARNTRKKARLQTDESDDNLLTIGLGTRGAYPSYPRSLGQSSRPGVISVLTEKPNHLAKNHEPFKFKSRDHQLFPSGVSLEQVNSQASSSTPRRDFLSDCDKTRKTEASVSTEHYIPSPANPPESLRTHEHNGGRDTKRKIWSSWGDSLSLKTGVISDENDAQHSYATPNIPSGFPLEQPNRFSAEENWMATPQFNPQEIQQVIRPFHLGSNIPSYHNPGACTTPVLSAGGRIAWEMSPMTAQNDGNVLLSLKPPEQGENGKSWRADQGKTSFPGSQPQQSFREVQNILLEWPRSTEPLLNHSLRPHEKFFESVNQGSSSEDPERIPQVSKIPKPHQPETITTVGNCGSQIDGIKNYGRIKFNNNIFKGEGQKESCKLGLLDYIPRPHQGNFLLTHNQLKVTCELLKRRHSGSSPRLSMHEVEIFMGNIKRWYQYWNIHAQIDVENLHPGEEGLSCLFVFPLFLIYVEMIISIIPFKKGLPLGEELNYSQEMRNAIQSFLAFNRLMKNPPENRESKIWKEKIMPFKKALSHAYSEPNVILWKFIDFWMEHHYTAVWNNVKENDGLHASKNFKRFFNTIFTYGIETLNKKI